jgi:hypothetical protein
MRWFRLLLRVLGWLLTPLVAWAASFFGAWAVIRAQAAFSQPRTALVIALAVAFLTGVLVLLGWMALLRHAPRLRHSLHVSREGLPVVEEEDEPESEPR